LLFGGVLPGDCLEWPVWCGGRDEHVRVDGGADGIDAGGALFLAKAGAFEAGAEEFFEEGFAETVGVDEAGDLIGERAEHLCAGVVDLVTEGEVEV